MKTVQGCTPWPADSDGPGHLRPDLLRVRPYAENLRVSRVELQHGRLELRALAVLVAGDRPADTLELLGEHCVAQCLLADIEVAVLVGLGDLFDRLDRQ